MIKAEKMIILMTASPASAGGRKRIKRFAANADTVRVTGFMAPSIPADQRQGSIL